MQRGVFSNWLIIGVLLALAFSSVQAEVLIKEVASREYALHVGGESMPGLQQVISREASLYVENGPAEPFSQVISREVDIAVASPTAPSAITNITIEVSATGESVTLDWKAYNQWATRDIARFDIYLSDDGPITDIAGLTPFAAAGGGTRSITLDGLTPYTDHFIVIVPVDVAGHFDPAVIYSAAYVLTPQVVSREVSLHTGGVSAPAHRQLQSREISVNISSVEPPPAIGDLRVSASPSGDSATLDWSGYNLWAVGDVAHFAIYLSDTGPISDVSAMTPVTLVSGEALGVNIDDLTSLVDHYFAVVPVDGLGQFDPIPFYGAAYILSPQALSREVSLFVGEEPESPYAQILSREVSLLLPDAAIPAPVTGLDSGFVVQTSSHAYAAVDLDWSSYEEITQGDITRYRIYVGSAFFEDVTGLEPFATVPAGTQRHTLSGLSGNAILHFAVVAEDALGNFDPNVRSFSAQTSISGVGEAQNLSASSTLDSLTFNWVAPSDAGNFITGYHLYFAGATTPVALSPSATSWQVTGLTPATSYLLRITTLDVFGNESDGISLLGATWLANPDSLAMTSQGGNVMLSWSGVTPSALVKHYAIYSAASPISDVSGLSPFATSTSTSLLVGAFTAIRDRYFAVATVNLLHAGNPQVSSILAGSFEDLTPPSIDSVSYGGEILTNSSVLTRPDHLSVITSDASGINRVDMRLDGNLLAWDTDGSDGYGTDWDITSLNDGSHQLEVEVRDSAGNRSQVAFDLAIDLAPPPAPVLTRPSNGFTTNENSVAVSGSIAADATGIVIYRNGAPIVPPVAVNSGQFQIDIPIVEGNNQIQASATNRGGEGPLSTAVTVTLDERAPDAPIGLYAEPVAGGEIQLSWNASGDSNIAGYALYRLDTPFSTPVSAVRLDGGTLSSPQFIDFPPLDGTWYYRVAAINNLDTQSELSNQVSVVADSLPPAATLIEYQPSGPHDEASGRIGVGRVDVVLHLSEEPITTPFLSIAPEDGSAQTVPLTWASETTYIGHFEVTASTPSSVAYAVFSARDHAGNRGTDIQEGATLTFDTDGPVATDFQVLPGDPIRNDADSPVTVGVRFGLSEPLGDGALPGLSYRLSGNGRADVAIALVPDGEEWSGNFQLPADGGAGSPESLTFSFSGVDDLGNWGDEIQGPNGLQVYQNELPPPETPVGLVARALPDGEVLLTWEAVDDVADYQLYRARGDEESMPLLRSNGALEWTDLPGEDGIYRYRVASVRVANAQESLSAPSAEVEAVADSLPPDAPNGLSLGVLGTGVEINWEAVSDSDPLSYRVYALPGEGLDELENTAPVLTGLQGTSARDAAPPVPVNDRVTYLVTTVDPAGNESDITAWETVNISLLPLATLEVEQVDDDFPRITWSHASSIAGVDLYLGDKNTGLKLNAAPLAGPGYVDTGWSGGTRHYTLVARDDEDGESLPRSLSLPDLIAERESGSRLDRGVMNSISYDIRHQGSEDLTGVVLNLGVNGVSHRSPPVDVPAGGSTIATAVVGGYADLPDLADLSVSLEQQPNSGERIRIVHHETIEVAGGVLLLELLNRDMTRGGLGKVRFAVENMTDVPVQLVVATAHGSDDSDDILILLQDLDGNRLSDVAPRQTFGPEVKTIADGRILVTIAPGERFESEWLDLPVPEASPETVRIILNIDQIHYHLGEPDGVSVQGLGTSQEVILTDTRYVGELVELSPEHSFGPGAIRIRGRALDREDQLPVSRVPLNMIIANAGFERVFELVTQADGTFSYNYQPLSGESGLFRVSIVHPDLLDRPEQGSFSVARIFVEPARQSLSFPRNIDKPVTLALTAGRGIDYTNVRFEYLESDQLFGTFDTGISVTPGAPMDIQAQGNSDLHLTLQANNEAPDSGSIMLRLVSDESPGSPLALVRLDYNLISAQPVLFPSPSYLELGTAPGQRDAGSLQLSNQGLAEVSGLTVELLLNTGAAAPEWAFLASNGTLGTLGIGAHTAVDINVQPSESVTDGIYELMLRISADNATGFDIPVFVYVTRSGVGGVLFHTSDIFTATLDDNNQPIPGLAGANIQVQHELIGTLDFEKTTDANGEALFTGLSAGNYLFRASAPDHSDVSGRLTIRPGSNVARELFLDYGLISLEWEVAEIPLEDRYEIVLHLTYETDVPAPVVVIEPPGITLPEMAPGQVLRGEFTITNYGLLRADNVRFTPASDDAYFDYEFLADVPDSLEAKQRITVPYRIVALRSLSPELSEDTGGGSCGYGNAARLVYNFICANGTSGGGGSSFGISADVSSDCGILLAPGGSGGGGFSPSASASPLIPCPPDCQGESDCCGRPGTGGGAGGSE